jgi:pimeloyl-ACP methyl ester carboxylesterase
MILNTRFGEIYAYTAGKDLNPAVPKKLPALVFIHGAQNDHSVWALQSRYFANHGYAVYALDLPGHGRSTGSCASVEQMAQAVIAAMDAAQVTEFIVVGHSMGSLVALELSALVTQQIKAIALVGTAAPMPVSDALIELIKHDQNKALQQINYWSHANMNVTPGNPGPGFSIYMQNLRLMQRQKVGVLLTDFTACNAYDTGTQRAQSLRCPTLIIQGSLDAMTPLKAAVSLANQMRENRVPVHLDTVEGAGHAIMAERPDAVLQALRKWLI